MKIQHCVRSVLSLILALSAASLVSCASGPSYSEAVKTLPPIATGKGRVFVYRNTSFGAAVRPQIKIDNQAVGKSVAQGFSYSDQTPGAHEVSLTTEWKHKDTVNVMAGKPSFVRTHVTLGALVGHVIPTHVDKTTGEKEIQDCKLVTE